MTALDLSFARRSVSASALDIIEVLALVNNPKSALVATEELYEKTRTCTSFEASDRFV